MRVARNRGSFLSGIPIVQGPLRAKCRSKFQRFLWRRNWRPSCVLFLRRRLAQPGRCSTRPEASGRGTPNRRPYRLMSRLGNSPRKLPARTSLTRRYSPRRSALHRYLEIACIRRVCVRSQAKIVIYSNVDLLLRHSFAQVRRRSWAPRSHFASVTTLLC